MDASDPSSKERAQAWPCAPGPGRALSRLEPWLLLLLAESPAHGYELLDRLSALPEAPNADRGHLYRTLRKLEEQGQVTSEWQLPQAGAARHTYTLSAEGLEALDAWAGHIRAALTRLRGFLERRDALRATEPAPGRAADESSCGP
jgi:PadR family transcriptional regulator, regulatory protein PadR